MVGDVGSGKSLIAAIMGQLKITSGFVKQYPLLRSINADQQHGHSPSGPRNKKKLSSHADIHNTTLKNNIASGTAAESSTNVLISTTQDVVSNTHNNNNNASSAAVVALESGSSNGGAVVAGVSLSASSAVIFAQHQSSEEAMNSSGKRGADVSGFIAPESTSEHVSYSYPPSGEALGSASVIPISPVHLPKFVDQPYVFGYVSQEPWLIEASLRDNIVFGEEWEEEKYTEVLRVCGLLKDILVLSNGKSI